MIHGFELWTNHDGNSRSLFRMYMQITQAREYYLFNTKYQYTGLSTKFTDAKPMPNMNK